MKNQYNEVMKRALPLLLISSFGFGLSACSPIREYRRPDVALPDAYPPGQTAPGKELARVPYREFFADPALLELIDSAVQNNQDLRIAMKNIEYARKSLNVAKLWFLPEADLSGTVDYSHVSRNSLAGMKGQSRTSRNYTATLNVSWEADIWARLRNAKKAALAEYLRSTDAARAVRTTLVSKVAQGYWNLKMLDEQIEIARRNFELAKTTLAMMRLQYNAGNVTSLAVEQQEAQLLTAKLALPKLEASRTVQENALSILAGRMPGTPIKRSGQGTKSVAVADSLGAGVPLALLRNRPDVRAAEESLMEAHAMTGVNKALMYPSISLTAKGGLNAIESSKWFSTPGSLFESLLGGLTQPVFHHGQLKAQYEQSKIKRDQAELTFRKTLLVAVGEVCNALVQVDKTRQQELLAARRVVSLGKAVRNSRLLFQSGMATYLDVLTAESSLLSSELELADVQRSHLAAMADLYRAVGGGWRE